MATTATGEKRSILGTAIYYGTVWIPTTMATAALRYRAMAGDNATWDGFWAYYKNAGVALQSGHFTPIEQGAKETYEGAGLAAKDFLKWLFGQSLGVLTNPYVLSGLLTVGGIIAYKATKRK